MESARDNFGHSCMRQMMQVTEAASGGLNAIRPGLPFRLVFGQLPMFPRPLKNLPLFEFIATRGAAHAALENRAAPPAVTAIREVTHSNAALYDNGFRKRNAICPTALDADTAVILLASLFLQAFSRVAAVYDTAGAFWPSGSRLQGWMDGERCNKNYFQSSLQMLEG